jgi:hypothetical protein
MVKLCFKTPSKEQPFELEIDLSAVTTVEQLKQKVADHQKSSVPNIKLIHKGTHTTIQARSSRTTSPSPPSTSSTAKISTPSSKAQNRKNPQKPKLKQITPTISNSQILAPD